MPNPQGWNLHPYDMAKFVKASFKHAAAAREIECKKHNHSEMALQATGCDKVEGDSGGLPNQTTALGSGAQPDEYYVIAEDVEEYGVKLDIRRFQVLDCIRMSYFWKVLYQNIILINNLEGGYNALSPEQIYRRRELLGKLLREGKYGVDRLSVLIYAYRPSAAPQFPAWKWTGARIKRKFNGEMHDPGEVPKLEPGNTRYFITAHLLDHEMAPESEVNHYEISVEERAFLDEIFSLNHIPDAPLDDGGTTEPPLVPTQTPHSPAIFLDEGGFSFGGGDLDHTFWSEGKTWNNRTVMLIPDDDIQLYPSLNKAYCRTTNQEFEVIKNTGEGSYSFDLVSEKLRFRVNLLEDRILQATAIDNEPKLTTYHDENNGYVKDVQAVEKDGARAPLGRRDDPNRPNQPKKPK